MADDIKISDVPFEDIKDISISDVPFEEISQSETKVVKQKPIVEETEIPFQPEITSAGVGAGIFGTQKVAEAATAPLRAKANTGINKLIASLGRLDQEQIEKIRQQPSLYKQTRDISEITEDIADIAQKDIREAGIESAKAADAVIEEKRIKAPKNKLYKSLGQAAQDFSYDLEKGVESNIPKPIIDQNPQLKGKAVPANISKLLQEEVGFLSTVKDPKGTQLTNYLKDISGRAKFNKQTGLQDSEKLLRDYRESVRSNIGKMSPEFDALKKKSAASIKEQETLKRVLGLKPLEGGEIEPTATSQRKLSRLYKDIDLNKKEIEALDAVLRKYGADELLKEADLAAIKKIVKEKGIDFGGASITKAAFQGALAEAITRVPGIGKAVAAASTAQQALGTKAQEFIATVGDSIPMNIAKGTAKALYKSLPIIGTAATYGAAKAEGLSPEEALSETIQEEAMETLLPGLAPSRIAKSSEVDPKQERKRLDKMKKEMEESAIIKEARLKGYNFNAMKARIAEESKQLSKSLKLNSDNQDKTKLSSNLTQISDVNLNKIIDKAKNSKNDIARSFLGPLEKAAESSERERATIMYGLQQQPAFREMLRRLKKQE
jgi:hypothetical protein